MPHSSILASNDRRQNRETGARPKHQAYLSRPPNPGSGKVRTAEGGREIRTRTAVARLRTCFVGRGRVVRDLHVRAHTRTRTRTHTHMHMHAHTHTHTQAGRQAGTRMHTDTPRGGFQCGSQLIFSPPSPSLERGTALLKKFSEGRRRPRRNPPRKPAACRPVGSESCPERVPANPRVGQHVDGTSTAAAREDFAEEKPSVTPSGGTNVLNQIVCGRDYVRTGLRLPRRRQIEVAARGIWQRKR